MSELPLNNIRVLDLSRVFAMPYVGAYLADLGAEVVKLDTHHIEFMDSTRASGFTGGPFPENNPGDAYWERGGTFQTLNRGKRSLTLDLRAGSAQSIVKDLVRVSDVVLENFTPRVMTRFGLEYASLRAERPDLVMVSNTGYGHSGPWSNFGAMASALEPTHGTGAFMGYLTKTREGPDGVFVPEEAPKKMGNSYTDFLATWTALGAIMASLFHRARTGRGMWIDVAMYQVGASFVGDGILDFAYNGRSTRRMGNRHLSAAPHGCYPCRARDEWAVIAVRDDGDWKSFCDVAAGEIPELLDKRFETSRDRLARQDELDSLVGKWTASRSQYQVMEELQSAGVPRRSGLERPFPLDRLPFPRQGFLRAGGPPGRNGAGTQGIHRPGLEDVGQPPSHTPPGARLGGSQPVHPEGRAGPERPGNRGAGTGAGSSRPARRGFGPTDGALGPTGRTGLDR